MDLYLNELSLGMPGMTSELRATFAQAAAVCFDSQGHASGVELIIRGQQGGSHLTHWTPISDSMRSSWDDPTEATAFGAVGVAVLLADKLLRKQVFKRARTGTGFDYWLGNNDADSPDIFTTRFEVSGIRHGDDQAVDIRVNQKLKQTTRSSNDFPVVVIVVEFGRPQAKIATH